MINNKFEKNNTVDEIQDLENEKHKKMTQTLMTEKKPLIEKDKTTQSQTQTTSPAQSQSTKLSSEKEKIKQPQNTSKKRKIGPNK